MKKIKWAWPLLLIGGLLVLPWGCYSLRPSRSLDVVVLDKTVPFPTRIEHRSLYWLLDYLKITRADGERYDRDVDYLGAFPGPEPGDRPSKTIDLTAQAARRADLLYIADTYGVYEEDLESGAEMKAALERSPKIYGGLQLEEALAVEAAAGAGRTVVVEFNTLASPTGAAPRRRMEELLGVRWTRWIGRFFHDLDDEEQVPQWMRDNYEREWGEPWEFVGAGYVLLRDDAEIEVFQLERQVERIGLTLEREEPVDRLLAHAHDGVAYPYWFDIVETLPGATTLASFQWHVTPGGELRLRERGLPWRFPAVVRGSSGNVYYFAGDFSDNPMPDAPIRVAGYLRLMRWAESIRLAPSETSFYWRFYVPLMQRVLEDAAR